VGGKKKMAQGVHANRSKNLRKPKIAETIQAAATERCGAKTRAGHPCGRYAMPNGRCRMHGGLSTGPKTPEGLERCKRAPWKHGRYSAESRAEHRRLMQLIRVTKKLIDAC
jgi:hypothetical protein